MVTIKANIDSGWSSETLTLVALRDGVSLGTASVTTSTVESVTLATATIDLSEAGAGAVDFVIRDESGSVAWAAEKQIDGAGSIVSSSFTVAQAEKIALIGSGRAILSSPVAEGGEVREIVKGDSYLSENGRAFVFRVKNPGNTSVAGQCRFVGSRNGNGAAWDLPKSGWSVEGTLTEDGEDLVSTFELTESQSNTPVGRYKYSVIIIDDDGNKLTPVFSATGSSAVGFTTVVDPPG